MTTNTNFLATAHYVAATKGGYHIDAIKGRKSVTIATFTNWDDMRNALELIVMQLDVIDAA